MKELYMVLVNGFIDSDMLDQELVLHDDLEKANTVAREWAKNDTEYMCEHVVYKLVPVVKHQLTQSLMTQHVAQGSDELLNSHLIGE